MIIWKCYFFNWNFNFIKLQLMGGGKWSPIEDSIRKIFPPLLPVKRPNECGRRGWQLLQEKFTRVDGFPKGRFHQRVALDPVTRASWLAYRRMRTSAVLAYPKRCHGDGWRRGNDRGSTARYINTHGLVP